MKTLKIITGILVVICLGRWALVEHRYDFLRGAYKIQKEKNKKLKQQLLAEEIDRRINEILAKMTERELSDTKKALMDSRAEVALQRQYLLFASETLDRASFLLDRSNDRLMTEIGKRRQLERQITTAGIELEFCRNPPPPPPMTNPPTEQ